MSSQPSKRNGVQESPGSATGVLNQPEQTEKTSAEQTVKFEEDRDTLVKLYYQMLLIRRFEEKCAESYSLGKIGGFCHLYIGQEAVGVGAISALGDDDYVLTSYREHG